MNLIGLTGAIGHGKTSLANAFSIADASTVHLETSSVIIELANAWHATLETPFDPYDINALNDWLRKLPSIIETMLDVECPPEVVALNPSQVEKHPDEYQKLILHAENLRRDFTLAHNQITPENKEVYRPLLQWLGGYLVAHLNVGIWFNELIRRAQKASTEGAALVVIGGLRFPADATIVRAAGGTIIKIVRPGHLQNDILDPTEREREKIQVDAVVMNTGDISDLNALAPIILGDIKANTLRQTYQTR